jgi:hypothetical protein
VLGVFLVRLHDRALDDTAEAAGDVGADAARA